MHHRSDRRQFVKHTALFGACLWTTGRYQAADTQDSEGLSLAEFRLSNDPAKGQRRAGAAWTTARAIDRAECAD